MLKKIAALFLAGITTIFTACSGGSTTPETDTISSFDQAKMYATINCETDTSEITKQFVWAYFANPNGQYTQLKDGSVKYNSFNLNFSENDRGYKYQTNDLFSSDLNDSLTVKIDGVVDITDYSRPAGYLMQEAIVDTDQNSIILTWNRIPAFNQDKDTYKITFTNLANNLADTLKINSSQINLPYISLPKSYLSAITDSTGTGRFMVTFTHHQKIVVGAPYASGSEIHANFVMNRKLRISAIPK